jgi:D-serine dehydratase
VPSWRTWPGSGSGPPALADRFGFASILGAFAAGLLVRTIDLTGRAPHPQFQTKLEGVGFGFLVPVFFITTGIQFDARVLVSSPAAIAEIPLFLAALLAVRGVPAFLYPRRFGRRRAGVAGLMQATTLTFVIVATQIGTAAGQISQTTGAALLAAGLLSAALFPAAALKLLSAEPRGIPLAALTGPRPRTTGRSGKKNFNYPERTVVLRSVTRSRFGRPGHAGEVPGRYPGRRSALARPGHVRTDDMTPATGTANGRNVLREDLPLPVCVLRRGALERNVTRFQRFSEANGVLLCPHAKTSMTPALFGRQLDAGCWGLTFATRGQLEVARRHGVQRVFYANQLVGAADIRYVCDELRRDPGFEFYCLVDSVGGVELLAERVAQADPGRRLSVLVEGGLAGGRCGVRDVGTAVAVAETVRAADAHLALVGVEGFEGLVQYREAGRRETGVREFLRFLVGIAETLDGRDLFEAGDVLLSAGGSAFYDLVIEELKAARLRRPPRVILRSGCYLTQDWGMYASLLADIHLRTGSPEPALEPALEVWAQVLSTPEPGLVILSAGRRDFGQEAGNPVALNHVRRGTSELRSLAEAGWRMTGVSDQHAHMTVPPGHGVEVGDLVALGPSHPCTTFDKWRVLYLVDDDYNVTETAATYF